MSGPPVPSGGRIPPFLIGAAALLLGLAGLGAWGLFERDHDTVMWSAFTSGALYVVASWWLLRHEALLTGVSGRRALLLILGTAALARAFLIAAPPVSTDIYRYVWDGRVQAAGVNPYRYRPADPALAALRDAAIYPLINRADTALTIYPPAAQWIFRGVTAVAPTVTAMKFAMLLFEALLIACLLALLRSRALPDVRVLIYAWHPLPLFEFAGSGHVDAAALGLMLLACLLAERRRAFGAGLVLGLATLVKFFPLAILPALYRRWDWRVPAATLLVIVVLYVPFLGVGTRVLGFLPGYVQQEGLAGGEGFFALEGLQAVLPTPLPPWASGAYALVAAIVLGGLALAALRRPEDGVSLGWAAVLLATFTVILSPHLAWYFTWVIPLLAFRMSWAWIYLSIAAPLLYRQLWEPAPLVLHALLYLPFAALLLLELTLGRRGPATESLHDRSSLRRHAD
jgi:hypothetical protein